MSWLTKSRSRLADEIFESYVRWREASARVHTAYRRWVDSTPQESGLEFATYCVALDWEEQAAMDYSELSARAG
jgi:hypothetical protein